MVSVSVLGLGSLVWTLRWLNKADASRRKRLGRRTWFEGTKTSTPLGDPSAEARERGLDNIRPTHDGHSPPDQHGRHGRSRRALRHRGRRHADPHHGPDLELKALRGSQLAGAPVTRTQLLAARSLHLGARRVLGRVRSRSRGRARSGAARRSVQRVLRGPRAPTFLGDGAGGAGHPLLGRRMGGHAFGSVDPQERHSNLAGLLDTQTRNAVPHPPSGAGW